MKWALWVFGLVAIGSLVWGSCEARHASRADSMRDSTLAANAVLKTQNAALATRGEDAGDQAARATARADSAARRAAALEAIMRRPQAPIPAPDSTARDSVRFWKATAEDLQVRLLAAGDALEAREVEIGSLRAALDSQKVATSQFRSAYEGERDRAAGLETALRKMPTGCRKLPLLGIPMPRVGPAFGAIHRQIDFSVMIPLGGC